jgi:hypothetical protein
MTDPEHGDVLVLAGGSEGELWFYAAQGAACIYARRRKREKCDCVTNSCSLGWITLTVGGLSGSTCSCEHSYRCCGTCTNRGPSWWQCSSGNCNTTPMRREDSRRSPASVPVGPGLGVTQCEHTKYLVLLHSRVVPTCVHNAGNCIFPIKYDSTLKCSRSHAGSPIYFGALALGHTLAQGIPPFSWSSGACQCLPPAMGPLMGRQWLGKPLWIGALPAAWR